MFTTFQQKPEKTPDKALIILDGKVIDKATLDAMNPGEIYSVNVLKGKSATDIYGRKGKNGVVLVTSKKPASERSTIITFRTKDSTGMKNGSKPLFIVNGKEISEADMKELSPDQIQSINVLKNEASTTEFGDKGKNGVVKINLKKTSTGEASKGTYSIYSSGTGDEKGPTIVFTSKGTGASSTSSTVNVNTSGDGNKKVVEKRYVITSTGSGQGEEQHIIINSDSDTKNGNTPVRSEFKLMPQDVYILLDGKEVKMSDVKAENIEKIEVLKGEAATAVYGKKGEKGVILITSKKK